MLFRYMDWDDTVRFCWCTLYFVHKLSYRTYREKSNTITIFSFAPYMAMVVGRNPTESYRDFYKSLRHFLHKGMAAKPLAHASIWTLAWDIFSCIIMDANSQGEEIAVASSAGNEPEVCNICWTMACLAVFPFLVQSEVVLCALSLCHTFVTFTLFAKA